MPKGCSVADPTRVEKSRGKGSHGSQCGVPRHQCRFHSCRESLGTFAGNLWVLEIVNWEPVCNCQARETGRRPRIQPTRAKQTYSSQTDQNAHRDACRITGLKTRSRCRKLPSLTLTHTHTLNTHTYIHTRLKAPQICKDKGLLSPLLQENQRFSGLSVPLRTPVLRP